MKHRLFTVVALLTVLGLGGFLVAASGIVPIKASAGHWLVTIWFLQFAKARSVATHTLSLEAPALDQPGLILKGAGHYDLGCRPCHGSPELRNPRIAQAMLPRPPYLPERVPEWEPEELFYIVKHGIKLTGMPAWPAQQRDDEVWAVVAFLRAFPDLNTDEYQKLVHGEASKETQTPPIRDLLGPDDIRRKVTENCGRCHGVDGQGRGANAFPRLAGQRPAYLYAALQAFARGERYSGIMGPIAAGLSPDEMRALALYYSDLPSSKAGAGGFQSAIHNSRSAIARGKAIALQGIPSQRVPACVDCHGPGTTRRNSAYPVLAGQYDDYLVLQLELFKKTHRGGSAYADIMRPIASRLTTGQMQDVAAYYESLTAPVKHPAQ